MSFHSNSISFSDQVYLRFIREYEDKRDLFVETLEHELPASLNIAHTVAPQAGML